MNAEEQLKIELQSMTLERLATWRKIVDNTADELLARLYDDDPLTVATAAAEVLDLLFGDREPSDWWRQTALGQLVTQKME